METEVQRIDHLGIVAGVIHDLKIVDMINERISTDQREEISTGEAVAGMIINGLGFSDRPMTLTPQFFQNKAMELLFRPGVQADHFNRFKLGRALDACYEYGCDNLFSEISMAVCQQEKVDCRFNSEDTTTFTLTGDYEVDSDEHAIEITHGYSKDHRPDLKQAVLELMVSQDGGIPIISQAWSGNASDNKIFKERAKKLTTSFKNSDAPRYLVADSKLYFKENLEGPLKEIPFITRVPGSISLEKEMIRKSLNENHWNELDKENKYHSLDVTHAGLEQRWVVVSSKAMKNRAEKRILKAVSKEKERVEKAIKKHSTIEFSCYQDAKDSLKEFVKGLKFHNLAEVDVSEKRKYFGKGRPKKEASYEIIYHVQAEFKKKEGAMETQIKESSCYVLASTVSKKELNDEELVKAYKGQNASVERGFRFLKDPLFFASSFFVKKPERIMGLLLVMTLALLVYSIAQRKLRRYLLEMNQTLPNQINKPTCTPTLRWIFQLMEGLDFVKTKIENALYIMVSGLTELKKKIINGFPDPVRKIYGLAN